jgi:hypothetical protein
VIEGLLKEFGATLADLGAEIHGALQPGLSRDKIDAATARVGLRLPDDVAALWQWHDGATPITDTSQLLGGMHWAFLPLEATVDLYSDLLRRGAELDERIDCAGQSVYWHPQWWPLVGDSEYVTADLGASDAASGTKIFLVDWAAGPPEHDAPSLPGLDAVVRLWLTAIRDSAWTYRPSGRWLEHWDQLPDLAKQTGLA